MIPQAPLEGKYTVDDTALRHGAGVEEEMQEPAEAYARFGDAEPTPYREGWLPGDSEQHGQADLLGPHVA